MSVSEESKKREPKLNRINQSADTLTHAFSNIGSITVEYQKKDKTYHKADILVYVNNTTGVLYVPAANILDTYLGVKPDMSSILEELSYPEIMYTMFENKYREVSRSQTFQILMSGPGLCKYINSTNYQGRKKEKQILYDALIDAYPAFATIPGQSQQQTAVPEKETVPEEQAVAVTEEPKTESIKEKETPTEVKSEEPKDILTQLHDMMTEKDSLIKEKSTQIENLMNIVEEQNKTIEELKQAQPIFPPSGVELGQVWDIDIHSCASVYRGVETFWNNTSDNRFLDDVRGIVTTFVPNIGAVHNTNNQNTTYTNIYKLMGVKMGMDFFVALENYKKQEGKNYSMIEFAIHDKVHASYLLLATYEYAHRHGLLYFLYQVICKRYNVPAHNVNFAIHLIRNTSNIIKVFLNIPYINNKTDEDYIKKHKKV